MGRIDIKNWKTHEIIFSYDCACNSKAITVKEALNRGVSLAYTDLSMISLEKMNLKGIDLSYASLFGSNLSGSYLYNANLKGTCLNSANLYGTNLVNCDLSYSDLRNVNLSKADLYSTNLSNAILFNAKLDDVFCFENITLDNVKGLNDECPKEGSFIGWKKCYGNDKKIYIVKLEIPEDAKRSSSTSKQCRCSKAKVLKIENVDGTKANVDEVYSWYNKNFPYKVGKIVEALDFDEKYWIECSSGIHFFMSYRDAREY